MLLILWHVRTTELESCGRNSVITIDCIMALQMMNVGGELNRLSLQAPIGWWPPNHLRDIRERLNSLESKRLDPMLALPLFS